MKLEEVYLGIDTSCYTTSLCFMNREGQVKAEARRILSVKEGRCGLQQSEMVYQHTRNLPELMEKALEGARQQELELKVLGIGVSTKPRPLADSYMPAFLAGYGLARSLAAFQQLPLVEISHQENHLEAGIWSAGGPKADRFLLLHASGGTTDLLLVERDAAEDRYRLTQVGGSMDLHAGQFVDRVGVALGLAFPAGPALEKLAGTAQQPWALPVAVQQTQVSLSGPATAALRSLKSGADPAALAAGVEQVLGETFARMLRNGAARYQVDQVLLVGGVGSNKHIRRLVEEKLAKRQIKLWVPDPYYSCDNASGCAAYARRLGQQKS